MSARRYLTLAGLALGPVLVLAVFFVLPVSGMVARGFDDGPTPAVLEVLGRDRTHRVVWFTVWSAGLATSVSVAAGAARGVRPAPAGLPRPRPGPRAAAGAVRAADRGGRRGLPAAGASARALDGSAVTIIAGLVFFNVAVVIWVVGAAWESLDPRPAEAAAALGASPAQVFRTVTLPALRPAVVSAASVVFLFCATSYGVVLTLGGLRYSSVETEIYLLTTQLLDLQAAAALSIVQLLAITALLVRRRPAPPYAGPDRLAAYDAAAATARRPTSRSSALTLVALALVAAPLLTLVVGSLRDDGAWTLANYRRLTTVGDGSALLVPVTDALVTSLRTAVDATWMSLLLGGPHRGRGQPPLGHPRRAPAARHPRRALHAPARGVRGDPRLRLPDHARTPPRRLLVPIAQALVALPLVVRTLVPVLTGIDDRQRQAAASLGAGPLRAFWTVDVPVVVRPLLVAAGFAFAVEPGGVRRHVVPGPRRAPDPAGGDLPADRQPGRRQLRHGAGRLRRPGRGHLAGACSSWTGFGVRRFGAL